MADKTKPQAESEFDLERMRAYMALSPAEKLSRLEMLNDFLRRVTPPSGKKAWEELKKRGW